MVLYKMLLAFVCEAEGSLMNTLLYLMAENYINLNADENEES
jgi:hypothetical protein